MAIAPTEQQPKPKKAKWKKRLLLSLLTILAILALIILFLPAMLTSGVAVGFATRTVEKNYPLEVTLKAVHFGWFTSLKIEGLSVKDRATNAPLLELDSASAPFGLTGILTNGFQDLPPIEISGLRTGLTISPSGETSLQALLASFPPAQPKTQTEPSGEFLFPLNSFTFIAKNWEAFYDDQQKAERLAFKIDSLQVKMTAPTDPLQLTYSGSVQHNQSTFPWVGSGTIENALNKDRALTVEQLKAEFDVSESADSAPFFLFKADVDKRSGKLSTTLELPTLQHFAEPFVSKDLLVLQQGSMPIELVVDESAENLVSATLSVGLENLTLSTALVPSAKNPTVTVPSLEFKASTSLNLAEQSVGQAHAEFISDLGSFTFAAEEFSLQPSPELKTAHATLQLSPQGIYNIVAEVYPVPEVIVPASNLKLEVSNVALRNGELSLQQTLQLVPDSENDTLVYNSLNIPSRLIQISQSMSVQSTLADQSFRVEQLLINHDLFQLQVPQLSGSAAIPSAEGSLSLLLQTPELVTFAQSFTGELPVCLDAPTVLQTQFAYSPNLATLEGSLLFPTVELEQPMVSVPQLSLDFSVQSDLQAKHESQLSLYSEDSALNLIAQLAGDDVDLNVDGVGSLAEFVTFPESLKPYASLLPEGMIGQLTASSNLQTKQSSATLNTTLTQSDASASIIYPLRLESKITGILDAANPQVRIRSSITNQQLLGVFSEVSTIADEESSLDASVSIASALSLAEEILPEQLSETRLTVSDDSFLESRNTFSVVLGEAQGASGSGELRFTVPQLSSQEFTTDALGTELNLDYDFDSAAQQPATLGNLTLQLSELYYGVFGVFNLAATAELSRILEQHLSNAEVILASIQNLETEQTLLPETTLSLNALNFVDQITFQQAVLSLANDLTVECTDFRFGDLLAFTLSGEATSFEFLNPLLSPYNTEISGGTLSLSSNYQGPVPVSAESFFQAVQANFVISTSVPEVRYNQMLINGTQVNLSAKKDDQQLSLELNSALEEILSEGMFPVRNINLLSASTFQPNGLVTWDVSDFSIGSTGTLFTSSGNASLPLSTYNPSWSPTQLLSETTLNGAASLLQRLSGLEDEFPTYTMSGDVGLDMTFSSSNAKGLFVQPTLTASAVNFRMPDLVTMRGLSGVWSPEYGVGISRPLTVRPPKVSGEFSMNSLTLESTQRPITLSGIIMNVKGVTDGLDLSLIVSTMLQGSLSVTASLSPTTVNNALQGNMQLVGLNLNAYKNPGKEIKDTVNLLGTYNLPLKRKFLNPVDQLSAEIFTYDLKPDSIRKLIVAVTDALELKTVSNTLTLLRVTPPTAASFLISYGLVTFKTEVTVRGGFTTPFYVVQNQPVSEIAVLYSPDLIKLFYTQLILAQDVLQANTVDELLLLFNSKAEREND